MHLHIRSVEASHIGHMFCQNKNDSITLKLWLRVFVTYVKNVVYVRAWMHIWKLAKIPEIAGTEFWSKKVHLEIAGAG